MARSIEVIQQQIIDSIKSTPTLYDPTNPDPEKRGLTSPSKVAIWLQWTYIVALAINIFEQLLDIFKTEIETSISLAPAGTQQWLQHQALIFQYDATNPQIIQFIDYAPQYPVIDATKRIITQCAVVNRPVGGYKVKVAASLAPLTTPQLQAFQSFLKQINFGVPMEVINADSDKLMITANIYYDGQYSAVIQNTVLAAINNYISDFNTNNFNGDVYVSKLEDIIQSVDGVKDVVLTQIEARPDTVLAASATKLVNNSQVLLRSYSTYAGYILIDSDPGRDLASTLTFIAV